MCGQSWCSASPGRGQAGRSAGSTSGDPGTSGRTSPALPKIVYSAALNKLRNQNLSVIFKKNDSSLIRPNFFWPQFVYSASDFRLFGRSDNDFRLFGLRFRLFFVCFSFIRLDSSFIRLLRLFGVLEGIWWFIRP